MGLCRPSSRLPQNLLHFSTLSPPCQGKLYSPLRCLPSLFLGPLSHNFILSFSRFPWLSWTFFCVLTSKKKHPLWLRYPFNILPHPKSQMSQKVISVQCFSLLGVLLPNPQSFGFGQHIVWESALPVVTNVYESPGSAPPFCNPPDVAPPQPGPAFLGLLCRLLWRLPFLSWLLNPGIISEGSLPHAY